MKRYGIPDPTTVTVNIAPVILRGELRLQNIEATLKAMGASLQELLASRLKSISGEERQQGEKEKQGLLPSLPIDETEVLLQVEETIKNNTAARDTLVKQQQ